VLVTPFTDLKTSKLFHSNLFVFFSCVLNKFKLNPQFCRGSFSRLTFPGGGNVKSAAFYRNQSRRENTTGS